MRQSLDKPLGFLEPCAAQRAALVPGASRGKLNLSSIRHGSGIRPHAFPPSFQTSRSGLEDSRLNYIEQHAERLGLDAGRLEGARVAASQGGLAGETLDLCAR